MLDDLQELPPCGESGADPDCFPSGSSSGSSTSSATESPTPTTSGGLPDVVTTTEDTAATLPGRDTDTSGATLPGWDTDASGSITDASSGSATAGHDAVPKIVDVELVPDEVLEAGAIAVKVEAIDAAEVTMTVDDGQPVSLTASGANFYAGAIEVHGASMNGGHSVLITASNAGLTDTELASFDVNTPPAGDNVWLKTSAAPDSRTRAVVVDADGNLYEVGTLGEDAAARLVVGKRDDAGEISWPGMWKSYQVEESWGEDVAIGPDGLIYVLGNYKDKQKHTRWWLAKLDPAFGELVGKPKLGEVDEPAYGLSVADNGNMVIVGTTTVWGENDTEDVQAKIWIMPLVGNGVIKEWGYSPEMLNNTFAEVPEDVAIVGERIFVTGSVEGVHPDDNDDVLRKRLFVLELDSIGTFVRTYVAGNEPYLRSSGNAVADDGASGVVAVGWACDDVCTRVGDMHWLASGAKEFVLYDRKQEVGDAGIAYAMDVAHSPSGYNVIASAVSMGPGLNLGLRVTGWRAKDPSPVLEYAFDTGGLEAGQAVTVGPHGYVWFGGVRLLDNSLRAVAGKCHGY